ncbi:MAG: hypothetical protein Tsb002_38530 [Wenzhouxiangellaceae bacterium]
MKKLSFTVIMVALYGSLSLFSSPVFARCGGELCLFGTEPWCTCEAGMGADDDEDRKHAAKPEELEFISE